jgi:hypothetical protein
VVALEHEREELAGHMREVLDRAEAEKRDLSRREGAQVREMERRLEALDDRIEFERGKDPRPIYDFADRPAERLGITLGAQTSGTSTRCRSRSSPGCAPTFSWRTPRGLSSSSGQGRSGHAVGAGWRRC